MKIGENLLFSKISGYIHIHILDLCDVLTRVSPTGCSISLMTGAGGSSSLVAPPTDSSPDVLCSLAVHSADW